jgi:predicted ATP-binding protein involved in virulence
MEGGYIKEELDTWGEECLQTLDTWAKQEKETFYKNNIKSPKNNEGVLTNYENELRSHATQLIKAITSEDINKLKELNWPEPLMKCIQDISLRTIIVDRIHDWFIQYPHTKSALHLEELENENAKH